MMRLHDSLVYKNAYETLENLPGATAFGLVMKSRPTLHWGRPLTVAHRRRFPEVARHLRLSTIEGTQTSVALFAGAVDFQQ